MQVSVSNFRGFFFSYLNQSNALLSGKLSCLFIIKHLKFILFSMFRPQRQLKQNLIRLCLISNDCFVTWN